MQLNSNLNKIFTKLDIHILDQIRLDDSGKHNKIYVILAITF